MYITKARALAAGLTHEGTLFGVPAWFDGDDFEFVNATPKFLPFKGWCWLADKAYELAAYITPVGQILESPITVKRRIA